MLSSESQSFWQCSPLSIWEAIMLQSWVDEKVTYREVDMAVLQIDSDSVHIVQSSFTYNIRKFAPTSSQRNFFQLKSSSFWL
jgi:hypothetical protein